MITLVVMGGLVSFFVFLHPIFITRAVDLTLTVNSTDDTADFDAGDGFCDTDDSDNDGPCTLRAAIQEANATVGSDAVIIEFDISGGGEHTIELASELTFLTRDNVTIDGSTQSGSSCGDLWGIGGAHIDPIWNIVLDINGQSGGLRITGEAATVKGLKIVNSSASQWAIRLAGSDNTIRCNYLHHNQGGINIDYGSDNNTIGGSAIGDGNVIADSSSMGAGIASASAVGGEGVTGTIVQGNFIGTNVAGTAADGNHTGIDFQGGVTNTVIGGINAGEGNLVSGNRNIGITFFGDDVSANNIIRGNYIGTNRTGLAAIPNVLDGIFAINATHLTIGGTVAGARNIISGNDRNGIRIDFGAGEGSHDVSVLGNYIGVGADGTTQLGNDEAGVYFDGNIPDAASFIGGTAVGAGNIIWANGERGVTVGAGVAVLGNSIYANTDKGISAPHDGAPTITLESAAVVDDETTITGSLAGENSTDYRLEFFASPDEDATGSGEGKIYLGYVNVTTDGSGTAAFSKDELASADPGDYASAVASEILKDGGEPTGYYSSFEFNENVQLNAPRVTSVDLPGGVFVGDEATITTIATSGGTIDFFACKAGDGSSEGCGGGGTWCSDLGAASNPSCAFTPTTGDVGLQSAFIYIFDSEIGAVQNGQEHFFYVNAAPVAGESNAATFLINQSADVISVIRSDEENYPPEDAAFVDIDGEQFNQSLAARTQAFANGISNAIFRWDTSELSDMATVTDATFSCNAGASGILNADDRNLTADWYSGDFDVSAYSALPQTSALLSHSLDELDADPGALNSIPLDNGDGLNVDGDTMLRLHIDGGEPAGVGGAFTCDKIANDFYPHLEIAYTIPGDNTTPTFTTGPSDGGSSSDAPTTVGSNVTFTATATDEDDDQYYFAICKTNAVTSSSNAAPTCDGGSWAISSATNSASQATVTYTTLSANFGTNAWYAFVCDKTISDAACSAASQGAGNNGSPFVVQAASSSSGSGGGGGGFTAPVIIPVPSSSQSNSGPTQPAPPGSSANPTPPPLALPIVRSLSLERQMIGIFGRLFGFLPKNSEDWLAIRYLAYDGTHPYRRNLETERQALKTYGRIFRAMPAAHLEWRVLSVIAYGLQGLSIE